MSTKGAVSTGHGNRRRQRFLNWSSSTRTWRQSLKSAIRNANIRSWPHFGIQSRAERGDRAIHPVFSGLSLQPGADERGHWPGQSLDQDARDKEAAGQVLALTGTHESEKQNEMPRLIKFPALFVLIVASVIGCGKKKGTIPDPAIARFVAAKRAQAKEIADAQTNKVPNTVWKFFDAIERNDWKAATNLFGSLQAQTGRFYQSPPNPSRLSSILQALRQRFGLAPAPVSALNTELWSPIMETLGTYEVFHEWDHKWMHRYGRDIIESIPTNSIYFGGTDPGRFVISALSDSHREGRPFFTLTQNALADGAYLDYLRTMYGYKISIPTPNDSQRAWQEYLTDAQERVKKNRLKPGEDVKIVSNRVQVSGQIAVMEINGLIAKVILEKNPGREFYLEESFPFDWMYPQLSPHGLILKLHKEPLAELSEKAVAQDRDYWKRYVKELIGDWVSEETSVKEICEFAEKVYRRKDLAAFQGDTGFAQNEAAQKAFSKLRSAIGGLYAWRVEQADTAEERERMLKEADFAFRQALALCPYSPEAVFRYVNLLLSQKRKSDAQIVAQTLLRLTPTDVSAKNLVDSLQKTD